MKLKINIILALLLGIGTLAYSQTVITGKIVDATTGIPVPYANLMLKGSHYGTISNAQGEFSFVMPLAKKKGRDTLSISRIGYKTKDIEINKLRKDVVIKLEPLPVTLKEVGVKGKPTTVKELLKHAWENYAGNILTDSMVSRHYYVRNYARHNRFFFSEKAVFSTSDNRMDIDSMYAYELKSSCGYLKAHRNKLLSVGAWYLIWITDDNGKPTIKHMFKHWRKAFIDTVYMKDDHLIFKVVWSNKFDKEAYRKQMQTVKLDPNWASLHTNAFNEIITNNIEIEQLLIDKTDNYKVLEATILEESHNWIDLDITSLSYRPVGKKLVLDHSIEYSRQVNKDKSFYVDAYSEMLLTDIFKADTSRLKPQQVDINDLFQKLQNNYPLKAHCFPDTTFGEWSKYNSIVGDSLYIKVNSDLEELHEKYKKK